MSVSVSTDHFTALLLGTAVGDALGLPAEGQKPQTIQRRWNSVWKMRLVFGRGMISDDTDHASFTALCLSRHPDDAAAFARALARELRWWFAALPAGIGLATAKACLKLWIGISPERSGVFSAGNGPVMRAPVIGVFHAQDAGLRRECVRVSTRITHTDPKAFIAALAVAEVSAWIARGSCGSVEDLLDEIIALSPEPEWRTAMEPLPALWKAGATTRECAAALGLADGVTGYALHTVPVAVYAWLRHRGDFSASLCAILDCGGDTDSTGAITAALAAMECGEAQIPREWLSAIAEWPRSVRFLASQGAALASGRPIPIRRWLWPCFLIRNLIQLLIVLAHGVRRLFPFHRYPAS